LHELQARVPRAQGSVQFVPLRRFYCAPDRQHVDGHAVDLPSPVDVGFLADGQTQAGQSVGELVQDAGALTDKQHAAVKGEVSRHKTIFDVTPKY
jgi:hypothetical protein